MRNRGIKVVISAFPIAILSAIAGRSAPSAALIARRAPLSGPRLVRPMRNARDAPRRDDRTRFAGAL